MTGAAPGRRVLLAVAALTAASCGDGGIGTAASGDPHGLLPCASCHSGGVADAGLAAVPPEACARGGCHGDDRPGRVSLLSVPLPHVEHTPEGSFAYGCPACHVHDRGGAPLRTVAESCGLCHAPELRGGDPAACRLCHRGGGPAARTNQGVSLPHAGLPWIETGCVRCHYQVARPSREVPVERCARCHTRPLEAAAAGIGEDLHPGHIGHRCSACHEADTHRIEAMSSAVVLQCRDCHVTEHGAAVDHGWISPETCTRCHADTHADAQRIFLGVGLDPSVQPSRHFLAGVVCRSCHTATAAASAPRRGSSVSCTACHPGQYATVLAWWEEGLAARTAAVDRYLDDAIRAVGGGGGGDAIRRAQQARALLASGVGHHNLPLAHRILQEILDESGAAYRQAGRSVPPPPDLGRAPRPGFCTSCHYRVNEPGLSERMDDAFHRMVVGRP